MYVQLCVRLLLVLCAVVGLLAIETTAAEAEDQHDFRLRVHADQPGAHFSKTMHGVFFEDINYAADGGLYAELVQNRSFEHPDPMYAWRANGEGVSVAISREAGLHENNPSYCRVKVSKQAESGGVANTGFEGFPLKAGAKYRLSAHLRGAEPGAVASVVVRSSDGEEIARAKLGEVQGDWNRIEAELNSPEDVDAVTLEVVFDRPGSYDLDMVSLFPADTFRGRRNGLRKDLAQKLADLQPSFVRFPGGCIVEGRTLENAYRWKDTVGPVWERKQNDNLWANRQSPQYQQTYGLGFFEFFQFCEDIDAEAVPIVNCGMACQARRGEPVPMDDLGPWVQDALDLVEFANGPVTSKWGKVRAEMGHPEPFGLTHLGVGNEQWMEGYFERYLVFHAALKQRYPELQIISTAGPQANDPFYRYAWDRFRDDVPAAIVDEHYYRPPQWFLSNSQRYDDYDRQGPKVFAGEFAAHEGNRASTLRAAVSESAFMTGLWRNADVVTMACYAPLFARVGAVQWAPDMIWFDNRDSYGTPSYYAQAMYAQNVPDVVVPVTLDASMIPPPVFHGRVGIGTWLTQAEFKDVRVTRGDETLFASDGSLDDWELFGGEWSTEGGVIRQSSEAENVRAFIGASDWSDYTVSLKAKKLAGTEGFLISFASTNPRETSWWNLGGWGNTEHGLESPSIPQRRTPGSIETGRWYDVRIEVRPDTVVCYLDGEEVQRAELSPTPAVFAASGWDEANQEYVVAVANAGDTPLTGQVDFAGARSLGSHAHLVELASDAPTDVNSFEEPAHVAPTESQEPVSEGKILHAFPACSFTIIRVPGAG